MGEHLSDKWSFDPLRDHEFTASLLEYASTYGWYEFFAILWGELHLYRLNFPLS